MNVDFAPLVSGLLGLASAAVTVAVPILVPALLKRWTIASDSDLADKLDTACEAAAGGAYRYALQHAAGVASVPIQNVALAMVTASVVNGFQDTMHRFGLTPEAVQAMVANRLGKLLAADPTVKAAPPTVPLIPPMTG